MKASNTLKIALISLTTIFGASIMTSAASAHAVRNVDGIVKTDAVSKKEARKIVRSYLKSQKNPLYRSLVTSKNSKHNGKWNVSIKSADGLYIATALVNAETGKITFKR